MVHKRKSFDFLSWCQGSHEKEACAEVLSCATLDKALNLSVSSSICSVGLITSPREVIRIKLESYVEEDGMLERDVQRRPGCGGGGVRGGASLCPLPQQGPPPGAVLPGTPP